MWANIYEERTGLIRCKKPVISKLPSHKIEEGMKVVYTEEPIPDRYISSATSVMPSSINKLFKPEAPPNLNPLPYNEPKPGQLQVGVLRMIGIGDVVMTIPLLKSIKDSYPNAHITYYTGEVGKWSLLDVPFVDRVEVVDFDFAHSGHPATPPPLRNKHDVMLNLVNRVDFGNIVLQRPRADNFILVSRYQSGLDLRLNQSFIIPEMKVDTAWAQELLSLNGVDPQLDVIIGCQITSHGIPRRWPSEKWCKLATALPEIKFIFFSDEPRIFSMPVPPNVINTSGMLGVPEFISLLGVCDVLVCPDSSFMHLGARLRKRTIILAGSTDPKLHLKYYPKDLFTIIWAEQRPKCSPCYDWQLSSCQGKIGAPWCMNRIKVRQVANAILSVLEEDKDEDRGLLHLLQR